MPDSAAFIARSEGKVQLELMAQGKKLIKLWEEKHGRAC